MLSDITSASGHLPPKIRGIAIMVDPAQHRRGNLRHSDGVKAARRFLSMATRVSVTCRTAYKLDGRPVLADRHEDWCLMETGWRLLVVFVAFLVVVAVSVPVA